MPTRTRGRRSRIAGRLRSGEGFTIVEVLIAALVLAVGVMSLFALLDDSVKAVAATRAREGATNLARALIEDAHTISYAQLSPSSVESSLQSMSGMSDASAEAGWQIVRGGVTYTVTAGDCSIDDPKDGYGKHDGTFCADSSTEYSGAGTLDTQPADLKRVTIEVKWKAKGRAPVVRQVATFTAAGEAIGLSASTLKLAIPALKAPTAPVVENKAFTELTFNVTAPSSATRVDWSVGGARQSTAATREAGSETVWKFTWPIAGVSDGAYQITAQAVNATGVIGPPVSITVTLIRNVPAAPKPLVAGYDTVYVKNKPQEVVELEWQPNSESNIIGYRTYKPLQSSTAPFKELTCPPNESELRQTASCTDFNPPEAATAKNLTYEVAALYRPANGVQELSETIAEGSKAAVTVIGGKPLPAGPNQPPHLEATKNADGSVTLSWTAPEGGPAVSFYRIYRGTYNYSGRYAITGSAASTTYTDTNAASPHEYWVTAVGEHLTESEFIGPVTK